MLNQILGFLIAPDGDFISFGTWTPREDIEKPETGHESAVLLSIRKNQWHLKYPELGLTKEMVENIDSFPFSIYACFMKWSTLGFIVILNGNTLDETITYGYFSSQRSFLQDVTLLLLKDKILYQSEILSTTFLNGEKTEKSLEAIYQEHMDQLFQENNKPCRKKKQDM